MVIDDDQEAIDILRRISYYRLSGYMLTYKEQGSDCFVQGTTFKQIHRLYEFDRILRNLLMSVMETIEISFRTHISYRIAHTYGVLGYMDASHFQSPTIHFGLMDKLNQEIERSSEIFVRHHKENYNGLFPVWVALELFSFGSLSKLYSNMLNNDKQAISKGYYKVPHRYVTSWLRAISNCRNVCAHFGRLYGRNLTLKPMLQQKDQEYGYSNDCLFAIMIVLKKLTKDTAEWQWLLGRLNQFFAEYPEIDLKGMGFPENWMELLMM